MRREGAVRCSVIAGLRGEGVTLLGGGLLTLLLGWGLRVERVAVLPWRWSRRRCVLLGTDLSLAFNAPGIRVRILRVFAAVLWRLVV